MVLILSLIFGWTLSVQDVSLISFGRKFCNFFWINLVFEIAFHTCFSFDLICLFWVNSVYLLCFFNRKFFSILSLIFGWTLPVKMFHWYLLVGNFVICFWINFVFKIVVLTLSACFGSIVFICYVVSTWTSSQLVLILSLIFGWTLSVQDVSLISFGRKFCYFFWINLVFEITFDTCCSFDLICLFWSIVFICYVVSAWTSSQLVLILSLIFSWTLSVQDVSLISFGRKFCILFWD